MLQDLYLIVGLGNPGIAYTNTRHNIGYIIIDEMINNSKSSFLNDKKFKAQICKLNNVIILKPLTFMNESGISVNLAKQYYKIKNQNIIVIHDDIDIKFQDLRFKIGGGNAGHNGLKSISEHIGNDYIRVRFGVGRPKDNIQAKDKMQISKYVLSAFDAQEMEYISKAKHHLNNVLIELAGKKTFKQIQNQYTNKIS